MASLDDFIVVSLSLLSSCLLSSRLSTPMASSFLAVVATTSSTPATGAGHVDVVDDDGADDGPPAPSPSPSPSGNAAAGCGSGSGKSFLLELSPAVGIFPPCCCSCCCCSCCCSPSAAALGGGCRREDFRRRAMVMVYYLLFLWTLHATPIMLLAEFGGHTREKKLGGRARRPKI